MVSKLMLLFNGTTFSVPFAYFNFFLAFLKYGTNFLLIYHITHKLLNEWEQKRFHDQTYDTIRNESLQWNRHMILQVLTRERTSISH